MTAQIVRVAIVDPLNSSILDRLIYPSRELHSRAFYHQNLRSVSASRFNKNTNLEEADNIPSQKKRIYRFAVINTDVERFFIPFLFHSFFLTLLLRIISIHEVKRILILRACYFVLD